ncbi:hypothetical protein Misp06_00291 [Microbulbifer sp. NBRC 101763]|uniref:hypothetical protein n=1 Tax=unclassified Microbulbifer TaxID=2619833 RepID=UPI0024ACB72E|nr:hypothetical protein [Microbulbifer sp. MLAF003]WHI49921.1 hypothetical protein P3339_15865 [Microbulbifer sp. MLAF003]
MRTLILYFVLWFCTLAGPLGCSSIAPRELAQSVVADTHLGWRSAPENQLVFSLATVSGVAQVELQPLPEEFTLVTLELPGMRKVEGIQWQDESGQSTVLYDGEDGLDGVSLQSRGYGFELQLQLSSMDYLRNGGVLTVIDQKR